MDKINHDELSFRIKRDPELLLGGILLILVLLMTILGSIFMPYDPDKMDATLKFADASWTHPFGCDNFGRDVFSRTIVGMRITLLVALGTVAIGTVFGTIIGAVTGYFGGVFDELIMRFNDAVLAFPSLLLALVIISVFGSGTEKVVLALGILFIPSFARMERSEYVKIKNLDYVRSARLLGASPFRIIFVHILPNTFSVLLPTIVIGFNNAVLAEAGMSYLGIGVQPPASSLGSMLKDAQAFLFVRPSLVIIPGLFIALIILSFALVGDGIKKWER